MQSLKLCFRERSRSRLWEVLVRGQHNCINHCYVCKISLAVITQVFYVALESYFLASLHIYKRKLKFQVLSIKKKIKYCACMWNKQQKCCMMGRWMQGNLSVILWELLNQISFKIGYLNANYPLISHHFLVFWIMKDVYHQLCFYCR